MKGYRTIAFSAIMTLVGMLGFKLSPETANHWMDVFVAFWGIGAILIRQITTTPVGGVSAASPLSSADLAKLQQDVQTLLGHSGATLQAAALTADMSQKFDMVLGALQTVAATAAAAANSALPGPASADQAAVPVLDEGADPALVPAAPTPAQPPLFDPIAPAAPAAAAAIDEGIALAAAAPRIIAAPAL
jgi:hypothetical protein